MYICIQKVIFDVVLQGKSTVNLRYTSNRMYFIKNLKKMKQALHNKERLCWVGSGRCNLLICYTAGKITPVWKKRLLSWAKSLWKKV